METYPEVNEALCFQTEEEDFEKIMEAVKAVRSRRAEMNVPPSKRPHITLVTAEPQVYEAGTVYMANLAYAGAVNVTSEAPADVSGMVTVVTGGATVYMPMAELVDLDKERERITKELAKARQDIANQEKKLANESFVSRAPERVVAAERDKLAKAQALAANLEESLKNLG